MMKHVLLIFFFFNLSLTILQAQIPTTSPFSEEQARAELRRRGVNEDEVIRRMREKGYDIENIDPNTVNIEEFQRVLEETIAEIEAEKQATTPTTPPQVTPPPATNPTPTEPKKEEPIEEPVSPTSMIYGHSIFKRQDLQTYNRSLDAKPPESYILGPGDELTVTIWGVSQLNERYVIDEAGFIKVTRPEIRIYLKGLTLAQARDLLQSRLGQFYRFRPGEFALTVNNARTITVNILGEVSNPGSFSVPALNTAFNVIGLAGGLNGIGSVRNIQIIRGTENRQLDVYQFLLNPSVQNDFFLQNNDYIFVPVADKIVSIQGAVRRPARYELLRSEDLLALINYAGGLKENAYRSSIQVQRYINDREEIIDVNLRTLLEGGQDFTLLGGDRIIVREIPRPYQNYVEVEGAVDLPGRYQYTEGMQINDLVERSRLRPEARLDIAYLRRLNLDSTIAYIRIDLNDAITNPSSEANYSLKPEDVLQIFYQGRFADKATVRVTGAVRVPSEFPFDEQNTLNVNDAITLAGGLKPEAFDDAFIIRRDSLTRYQNGYLRINVREAMNNPNSPENIPLQPFDEIQVFSSRVFTDSFTVQVQGAVRQPGTYLYDKSLSLKDALTLAGGLRLEAATNRIDIFRVLIQDNQPTQTVVATVEIDRDLNTLNYDGGELPLEPFDIIVVRQVPDFEILQPVIIQGEVKYPGTYALIADNERVSDIIDRSGGLTPEAFPEGATLYRIQDSIGYIVMDLKEVLRNENSRSNFILKEGDIIYIPKQKDLVTIIGSTRAKELYPDKLVRDGVNVAYHAGKNAKYYIDRYAAGIGEDGKASLVTVEHPNGRIERTRNFGLFKIYPSVQKGSVIKVGRKPERPEDNEQLDPEDRVNWGEVVANSIAQATSILSLILLVQRVSN